MTVQWVDLGPDSKHYYCYASDICECYVWMLRKIEISYIFGSRTARTYVTPINLINDINLRNRIIAFLERIEASPLFKEDNELFELREALAQIKNN